MWIAKEHLLRNFVHVHEEENKRFAERVRTQGRKIHFSSESDHQIRGKRPGSVPKKDFAHTEVESLLQQNKGTEFPMDHNLRVIHTLFQSNSENWSRIAQEHKNSLGIICNEFLGGVVDHNWPLRMHKQLRTSFLDPQMKDIMKKAQEEVDLLRVDLHFEQHSYDPEYEKRLKYWRTEASKDGPYAEAEEVLEKMLIHSDVYCNIIPCVRFRTNTSQLLSKTFLSNVVTQIVERHLLQGLLSIFSLVKIIRMDEATVVAIAAENKEIGDKRIALKRKRSPSRRQPIFAPVSPCVKK